MSNCNEIIERLENLAKHAVHYVGEPPFVMSLDDGIALHDAINLLREQEPRVIPLSELLTFDAKWQFNTPPYLCTEEIDTKRMWWRSWKDIYHSIRCEGTMGSNNYGTEWRCWTFHPTEEQRKAAAWDG